MAKEIIVKEDKKLIEQWLKNNKITICEAGAITEDIVYTFGSKKKKAPAKNAK
jgi:hypothetical protein